MFQSVQRLEKRREFCRRDDERWLVTKDRHERERAAVIEVRKATVHEQHSSRVDHRRFADGHLLARTFENSRDFDLTRQLRDHPQDECPRRTIVEVNWIDWALAGFPTQSTAVGFADE